MDSLSIGVLLIEKSFDKSRGGAFTYYEALIEAIDQFQFDKNLDIKFINIGADLNASFRKPVVQIDYKRSINSIKKINRLISSGLHKLGIFKKLQQNLKRSYTDAYKKSVENSLLNNKIELLYYPYSESQIFNYPFIMTHWDTGHKSTFSFPEFSMNNTYENRENYVKGTLEKAFAIFCESQSGRNELIRYCNINPERIFVMPMFPGNLTKLSLAKEEELTHLKEFSLVSKQFFFYPAQFWSHKNHYNLLIAFKRLTLAFPNIKLLFTGSDKGNLSYIKTVIVQLQLVDRVVITGFVSSSAIYSFYKNAVALVMPTLLGPTNMPLLEAAELGCSVICSDFKGHREMMGTDAYYIKADEPESIYNGLLHFQTNLIATKPYKNSIFNIENSIMQFEANLLSLVSKRKLFGLNFRQY